MANQETVLELPNSVTVRKLYGYLGTCAFCVFVEETMVNAYACPEDHRVAYKLANGKARELSK